MDQCHGRVGDKASKKNITRVSVVRWHLLSDDQFYTEAARRSYLGWGGLIPQNSATVGLTWGWRKVTSMHRVIAMILCGFENFFTRSLQLTGSFFTVVSLWGHRGSLEFHLSKQVVWFTRSIISRHVQQCIICSIGYNVYHKICTWLYIFLPGYRAKVFCYALYFMCEFF